MTKCFLHSCLFALLTLFGLVAEGRAQDSTKFIQDTIRIGSIAFGSAHSDTAYLRLTGQTRDIAFESSDTVLKLSTVNPFHFDKGATTIGVAFRIIPNAIGNRTVLLVASDTGKADTVVVTFNAFEPNNFRFSRDTIKVGQLLVGAPVIDSFYIVSLTNDIKIASLSIPDSAKDSLSFFIQFPILISEGDSALVEFSLMPRAFGPREIQLVFRDSTGVSRTALITLEGILPTSVDTVFELSKVNTLARVSNEDVFTMNLRVRNDGPTEIVITDFNIADTVNFGIEDFPLLPLILSPGSSSPSVEVYSRSTGSGFYQTTVSVPTVGGLASEYTVGVQVLKIIQASVPPTRTRSGIVVHQSATEIAIEHLPFEYGMLEIYDLLGRKLIQHEIDGNELMIPKRDATGIAITDGGYLLRLTDSRGQFSETIKVLLVSY
jgi:hypothetical protein